MKELKRILFRCFFVLEVLVFVYLYTFGSQGLPAWFAVSRENKLLETEIQQLKLQIGELKEQTDYLKNFDLPKEKIAREQLQMARADDYVFYFK